MTAIAGLLSGCSTGIKLLRSRRELPAMVVALAVGVGLTVTVYSLIVAVLLTPLPYSGLRTSFRCGPATPSSIACFRRRIPPRWPRHLPHSRRWRSIR